MTTARSLRSATLLILMLAPLGGCLTPRIKPQLSQEVVAARARAHSPAPAGCPQTAMSEISPTTVGFPFGDTALPDMTGHPLATAAHWLTCNTATPVVVKPDADYHGTDAEQDAVALSRAKAVQDYLTSQGVAPARIRLLARGAAEPAEAHFLVLAEGRRW